MKKVSIITLGCKVNQYDSEAMAEILEDSGYEVIPFTAGMPADVYVINTCTVTGRSGAKSRQMISKAASANKNAVIAVTGCYPQIFPHEVMKMDDVDIILGTRKRDRIVEYLHEHDATGERIVDITPDLHGDICTGRNLEAFAIKIHKEHTRAFVKIEDGCSHFCSYCIVPYARGPVRSREPADILDEVRRLAASGYKEIVLSGINLAAYGSDFPAHSFVLPAFDGSHPCNQTARRCETEVHGLASIMEMSEKVEGIERIRMGSLDPEAVTPGFVERAARIPKLCPHFHVSLQSGCDGTLTRMNRRYSTGDYSARIGMLQSSFADCAVSTDIMVGFPGETEEEFEATVNFIKEMRFSRIHVFKYSKRPGTPAASMPEQVPEAVKDMRSRRIIKVSGEMALAFHRSLIGRQFPVLVESSTSKGVCGGLTPNYAQVEFECAAENIGEIIDVTLLKAFPGYIAGTAVTSNPHLSLKRSFKKNSIKYH